MAIAPAVHWVDACLDSFSNQVAVISFLFAYLFQVVIV
jgi:hypothetical protein